MRAPARRSLAILPVLLLGLACEKQPEPTASPEPQPASAEPEPGPALWVASDADTTVYLFGTVHILPPGLEWRTPAFEAAFDEAAVVYFEADVTGPKVAAEMALLMAKLGMYDEGQTLSAALGPERHAAVSAAAVAIGVPAATLEPMRPWIAAVTLESLALMNRGWDAQSGVEAVLGGEAAEAGKQLRYFETAEQQLHFFADLPEAEQIAFLLETAKTVVEEPEGIEELVQAWAAGDTAKLEQLVYEDAAMGSDAVVEVLLRQRNRAWVTQLQALIDAEPGVFFVAVGAAHLAGEDGVPALLRAAGVDVAGP